jgi:hypothetical protein
VVVVAEHLAVVVVLVATVQAQVLQVVEQVRNQL